MLERVRVAWRSVRPPDALAAAFLCLLLTRKCCTGDLNALLRGALSSAAASSPELSHLWTSASCFNSSSGASDGDEEKSEQQPLQQPVADVNALLLALLGLSELSRVRDTLQQPGGGALEAVATRSPPYSILTTLRYLLAFVFPEQYALLWSFVALK